MDKLVCIVGPTASGKTALAVALAQRLDGEIVSADSMQIYRGMDIGTAKPDLRERGGVPHHMLDTADPEEEYSAARYAAEAGACVDGILARGHTPIVAGGTGLYLNALLGRISFDEEPDTAQTRERLSREAQEIGAQGMYRKLCALDPEYARTVHPNNLRRVLRGLEIIETRGITVSESLAAARGRPLRYEPVLIGLSPEPRELIWTRTDRRVDEMMRAGLLEEARRLCGRELSRTARQAIGYKELFSYFDGQITLEEAVQEIKIHTRQYAKRQLTWFRADPQVRWIPYTEDVKFDLILQNAQEICRGYGIMKA